MMIFLEFPLHFMESLKRWSSLHGYIAMFTFLTTVSTGLTCEAPLSPQCFRRNADESVYICEWSMNTSRSDVTFDFYFDKVKFGSTKNTWCQYTEEQLIKSRPVDIWVEAHVGNSSCISPKRSVVLRHTVKYEAPKDVSVSWLKNNLSLIWRAAEKYPALAEVWFRQDKHPTESWEKRKANTTTKKSFMYQVIVVDLLKHRAYQVQIRHQPTQARAANPLWSDWSPVVIVPAELQHKPEVTVRKMLSNGIRSLNLTWKPMLHAAAVRGGGVTYSLSDTQCSRGCPCPCKKTHNINTTYYTTYASYSAVNITVTARNAAGYSPPAIIQVPAEPAVDLETCDKTLLEEKLNRKTCLEWYEFSQDSRPENVVTLTSRNKKEEKKEIKKNVKEYVRYVYLEHRCMRGKPQTVKMCLFYKKEGVPRKPQNFITFGETHNSAYLSWKAIPSVDQRGFLTHYRLCTVKISSQDEQKECHNISASLIKYRLENLTPGTKYNVSLAGVTKKGEGIHVTATINTHPKKPVNVWLSLGLLFGFFLMSIMCTFILKRIKNKILPPVPTPVILHFTTRQLEESLEKEKEEVHDLTLLQPLAEAKSLPVDAEETTVQEWDNDTDEDMENERGHSRISEGTSDMCLSPGSTEQAVRSSREEESTEQVDEITMLIYRKGLVFDMKTDSS